MMNKKVAREVLEKIKPTLAEEKMLRSVVKQFLQHLHQHLPQAKAILGGSGAKGTWLAQNHDTDVYVLFPYHKYAARSDELADVVLPALHRAFGHSITRLHGSRDYFQLSYKGFRFEVVPLVKISKAERAKNITDISPLHAVWVNKHSKHLKEQIILAKQFCKAQGLYGAESYIQGFSGYVLEILIAHYGSFEKLLKAAVKWKEKEVIDPARFYPKKDALFHLNRSKQLSPLIVIDPVDKNRNAAAALSREKWIAFRQAAQQFQKRPNAEFFFREPLDEDKLEMMARKKGLNLVWMAVVPRPGKKDVVGSQLRKAFEFMKKKVARFGLVEAGWEWQEKALFYFLLKKKELPAMEIRVGPPLALKEFVTDFRKKNRDTFKKNGRIMARVPIERARLQDFVQNMLGDNYLQDKCSTVKKRFITY